MIQDLGLAQLESTLKIIMVAVEISLFGYDLTIGNLVRRGLSPTCVRTPSFLKLAPWRRVLRTPSHPQDECPKFSIAIIMIFNVDSDYIHPRS